MFYLFKNKKGIAISASKDSLKNYIAGMDNGVDEYVIKNISSSATPTDFLLDKNGNVIFPKNDEVLVLAFQKKLKLKEIDEWTESKITGGFVSEASGEKVTYDSDLETQITMQGIALNVSTPLFAEKYPNGCPVRGVAEGAEGKLVYWLTPEQVMQWLADLSLHIGTCKQAGWAKQAEVEACKTVFEVDSVTLGV
ncbi:hypothetical protein [Phascolarctobacterium succinatutens]|uniref:DUF4376 domain-containing protein n=1 Tax=Phascolarctobacterium succinatutens TaxID=626940 RepID=UPI0026EB12C1|nr:hypothetical protein [Phascolarctobacterium succinatutens]